jgi:hypothetical protein
LFPALAVMLGAVTLFAPRILGAMGTGTARGRTTGIGEAPTAPAAAIPAGRLVAWALDEAVGILGLVWVLLGGSLAGFVPFLVGSALLLWVHRP